MNLIQKKSQLYFFFVVCLLLSDPAISQTWDLNGNAGTNPATMFIGTTDSKSFRIRTNNAIRMHINASGKVGIGNLSPVFKLDVKNGSINTDSLYRIKGVPVITRDNTNRIQIGDAAAKIGIGTATPNNTLQVVGDASFSQDINVNGITIGKGGGSGAFCTVIGEGALNSNTTGYANTAIGEGALTSNTTGNFNTANGLEALYSNSIGSGNTANGGLALYSNTTGDFNTANGTEALYSNTTGNNNTANGCQGLYFNTAGFENTANGYRALFSNTTGSNNTANGSVALYSNTTGSNNTANGKGALYSNTTGSDNTANGTETLVSNTTGNFNTANGYRALYFNTTGFENTAIGGQALRSNTTGFYNTANGGFALYLNTTGSRNTANGNFNLYSNTTGSQNTAIGEGALFSNITGNQNTASGRGALINSTTGNNNTAHGSLALYLSTTGSANTANGSGALYGNIAGSNLSAVGAEAGDAWSSINNSVFVGCFSDATINFLTNSTAIGYDAQVDASNKMRFGNTSVTSIGGQVAWSTFSDGRYKRNVEEDVPGLEFITKLRPVTYTSDITGLNNHYPKPALREGQRQAPEQDVTSQEAIRYSGFIAQEVETAAKEIGYDFSGVDKPQQEGNLYGLRYSDFVVPMVKAIQEQQDIIEKQQKEIDALKSLITGNNTSGAIKLGVSDGRDEILLGQNIPNPADNSTIIPFSIPANCKSASILITDHATGRAIKAVPLSCKDTHLMLDAGSLASGTYSYTLFIDGASFDTKQMVIIK